MKRHLFFGTLVGLLISSSVAGCYATASPNPNEHLFFVLDSLIEAQPAIIERHVARLDRLRQASMQEGISETEQYRLSEALYEGYAAFQYDSAYHYVNRCLTLNKQCGGVNNKLYISDILNLAHIYSVAGFFEEAQHLVDSIPQSVLQAHPDLMVKYASICNDLCIFKAEFTHGTPFATDYVELAQQYREQIIQLSAPESYDYIFARAAYECDQGNVEGAIRMLENLLYTLHSGERHFSVIAATIAFYYQRLGNREKQQYYFALSAISDFEACVRENNSLRELSAMLFDEGDVNRAYRYLTVCINDANYYGSRLRGIQAGQIMPLVMVAWEHEQSERNRITRLMLIISSFFVLLFALIVSVSVVFFRRYRGMHLQLRTANATLETTVSQLEAINRQQRNTMQQVKEADKIKNEYIGRFLKLCSSFIDSFESQRRSWNRMAMDRETQKLYAALKNNDFTLSNIKIFYQNFDSAFLAIYPNFVSEVNKLFPPEAQLVPPEGEKLTTELRILALMRLGIVNNEEISNILRSSMATIYTYRSKMKKRALNKESFDEQVCNIDAFLDA